MNKISIIGTAFLAILLTGCATHPIKDVTYLPRDNTGKSSAPVYYNNRGEVYNPNGPANAPEYKQPQILRMDNVSQQSKTTYEYVRSQPIQNQQPQVVYQQPQVVYQQPQVVYQQPQVVYQQPQVVYQQPQVVYQQPQVIYQEPVYYSRQPVYQTRANIGGAILGGATGAVLGNELTRNRYYTPHRSYRYGYGSRHRGYYRSAPHGNLAVVGLGAAVGTMAGSGCQTNGGTIVGALIGGAIGQSIGKGSGRAIATAIGSGSGALIGSGC